MCEVVVRADIQALYLPNRRLMAASDGARPCNPSKEEQINISPGPQLTCGVLSLCACVKWKYVIVPPVESPRPLTRDETRRVKTCEGTETRPAALCRAFGAPREGRRPRHETDGALPGHAADVRALLADVAITRKLVRR